MEKLKVCVIGVGKMGKYHVREFFNTGCEVAVLEANEETAKRASEMLKKEFGISARGYWDFNKLIKNEKLDVASICVPPKLHSFYARKCLNANLHVFCEKPFVLDNPENNYKTALELVNLAKEKKKILAVDTQWVSALEFIPKEILPEKITKLSFYMHPIGFKGLHLLTDCIPHFNSILLKLLERGEIKNINFPVKSEEEILANFDYINKKGICKISYGLKNKTEKPSEFGFLINDYKFARKVGENYKQKLAHEKGEIEIEDPLKMSIKRFLEAVKESKEEKALVLPEEILQNVKMQDIITAKYLSGIQ